MAIDKLKSLPPQVKIAAGVEAVLKLIALRAAIRNRQYRWVLPLVIVNSAGLLPLVYLVRFQRR